MNHNPKKSYVLLAAAAAALALSGAANAGDVDAKMLTANSMVHCHGINACKGMSACATAENACKGQNSCKGHGFLVSHASECFAKGGMIDMKNMMDARK